MAVDHARLDRDELPLDDDGESMPIGSSMPERVLQELLRMGLAKVHEDPELVNDLLFKLDSDARQDALAYFAGHAIPVRLDIPIDDFTFPLVAVEVTDDQEDVPNDLLGDFMTYRMEPGGTGMDEIIGHALKSTYTIYCLAGKDSNAAMWLYYVVKAILVLNLETLVKQGLSNITISGRGISFKEETLPEMVYGRVISLTCTNYFAVRRSERVATSLELSLFVSDNSGVNIDVTAEAGGDR